MIHIPILRFWILLSLTGLFTACSSKPDTPVEALNAIVSGLSNNRPEVLWDSLPASYQKSINRVVQRSVSLTEKHIYDSSMKLFKRVSVAVKQKREIILKTAAKISPSGKINEKRVAARLDAITSILASISKSQVMSYDRMRKVNVGKFIRRQGPTIMKAFFTLMPEIKEDLDSLKKKEFSEVSRKDGIATIRLMESGKALGTPILFVKVEGRWIPVIIQRRFTREIKRLNARINKAKISAPRSNARMKKALPMLEKFVSAFERAKNEDELTTFPIRALMLGGQLKAIMK